ncbi:MAG: succinylglutamate desuccinylase/aspartoacylase family protein [Deltaproteobacteria bacterium]|nr:succinylglutamate desuccinylase/aspartoacylase family protein [Deltaproteobacteria bacterium]MBW2678511.1 succinylglutamate desuccinylase/aspartoacylase family protein [Deltaproteobacteria bacterium]
MITKTIEDIELPQSSMGNARSLKIIRYGNKANGKKAYIQAGLHADEPPGLLVMHHLMKKLDRLDKEGRIEGEIVLVPVANPVGISQWRDTVLFGRADFNTGVNFNRNHFDITDQVSDDIKDRLGKNTVKNVTLIRKSMSGVLAAMSPEDESAFLKHRLLSLACDADIVLDLHCDLMASVHIYMGTPLWPDATDLSAEMGAEVTLLAKESGDNPFDEACSRIWWDLAKKHPDFSIPAACLAATVELRGAADVSHELASKDARGIMQFLTRRSLIEGQAAEIPALLHDATPLRGVEHVKAPAPGVVVFLEKPGATVESGTLIAEIVNPVEPLPEKRNIQVKSTIGGILFSINIDRYARPGRILAKIAGKKPIEGKGKNLLTL